MANTVGLIGVGAMGLALLTRLRAAGREVSAFDVAADRLGLARDEGADVADSVVAATRGAGCVHVFVRTDDELLDVTLGHEGVLESAAKGTIVFLHSTVLPQTTRRVAEAAAERGIKALDAPVSSVPRAVREGKAVFFLGGSDDLVAEARPHLEPLGAAVYHFGPTGSGNVAKIARNLINAAERVALAEVLAIVEAGGLDVRRFLEMAVATDGGSTVSRWERAFEIRENRALPRPATNLLNKDVGLAAELCEAYGLNAPVTAGAAATAAIWVAGWNKAASGSGGGL